MAAKCLPSESKSGQLQVKHMQQHMYKNGQMEVIPSIRMTLRVRFQSCAANIAHNDSYIASFIKTPSFDLVRH